MVTVFIFKYGKCEEKYNVITEIVPHVIQKVKFKVHLRVRVLYEVSILGYKLLVNLTKLVGGPANVNFCPHLST